MMRSRRLWMACSSATLCLCCLAIISCGGSGQDDRSTNKVQLPRHSVGACLQDGGAIFARSTQDLSFLAEAEAADQVSKPGFAYDRRGKVAISVWTDALSDSNAPQWTIWIGQPFGETRSPFEIAGAAPPHSYVLYVNHPTTRMQGQLSTCIDFSGPANSGKVYEHSVVPGK